MVGWLGVGVVGAWGGRREFFLFFSRGCAGMCGVCVRRCGRKAGNGRDGICFGCGGGSNKKPPSPEVFTAQHRSTPHPRMNGNSETCGVFYVYTPAAAPAARAPREKLDFGAACCVCPSCDLVLEDYYAKMGLV